MAFKRSLLTSRKREQAPTENSPTSIRNRLEKRTRQHASEASSEASRRHRLSRLASLPTKLNPKRLVHSRNKPVTEFTIRRRSWRRGTWIYLSTPGSDSLVPAYYVKWSSFTPRKPTLTLHAGPDEKAPVVGRCWIPRLGHRIKVKIGHRHHHWKGFWLRFRGFFHRDAPQYGPASSQARIVMIPERMFHRYPGWRCEMWSTPARFRGHRASRSWGHNQDDSASQRSGGPTRGTFRWINALDGHWVLYPTDRAVEPQTGQLVNPAGPSLSVDATPATAPLAITDSPLLPHLGPTTVEDKRHVCVLQMTGQRPRDDRGCSPIEETNTAEGCASDGGGRVWERAVLLTALAGRFREMRSENRGTVLVVNQELHDQQWVYGS